MNSPISRRNLAKGVVWSAPVVIASSAVPVYAASRYIYQTDPVQNSQMSHRANGITDLYVYTTDATSTKPAGFSVWYNAGEGEDTTATLQKLEYYVMIPTQFDNDGTPATYGTTSQYWTPLQLVSQATLPLSSGSSISTQGYNLYKMTYTGPTTFDVRENSTLTTWPETTVDLGFFGYTKSTTATYYSGYVSSYTTANGVVVTNENDIRSHTVSV